MANVEKNTLYCSFCGKAQHEVKKLISGPSVFICDECTILCLDILVEEKHQERGALSREQSLLYREGLMRGMLETVKRLVVEGNERHKPYALLSKQMDDFEVRARGLPTFDSK